MVETAKGAVHVKGQIELPRYNYAQHEGKRVVIEKVRLCEGDFGFYYIAESVALDSLPNPKGVPFDIRASVLLGLHTDANGDIGWGAGTKTDLFLKKHSVDRPEQLVGADAVVVIEQKGDKKFLKLV